MVSYLIVSQDKQKREEYAMHVCRDKGISQFDIILLERSKVEKKDTKKIPQSLGIEDIKQLQKKLSFRPLKGALKACIIRDAQLLTVEAQNAMLKLLEEPPPQTLIFLTADTEEAFLPTILSRCQIIALRDTKIVSEERKKELMDVFTTIGEASIASKLSYAELFSKNKEEATLWIEENILTLREKMLTAVESKKTIDYYVFSMKQFQKTYTLLKTTNVNVRLIIENLFLSL